MKLTSAEYREIARESLRGHWAGAIAAAVLTSLLGGFCMSLLFLGKFAAAMAGAVHFMESIPHAWLLIVLAGSAVAVFYFFVGGIIRLGYIDYNLAVLDRRKVGPGIIFSKGRLFWQAVCMRLALLFIQLFCGIFLIVPGIIVSYRFAMTPYILEERPSFSVRKAMRESGKMMKGHKWQLFCLHFSFLGWRILGMLTLGIANLYVLPYRHTAEAVFYNEISGRAAVYYGRKEA